MGRSPVGSIVMSDPYRKLNSFVGWSAGHGTVDVQPLLQKAFERGDVQSIPPDRREVVTHAFEDLLGSTPAGSKPLFQLHPNVREEIARLKENEVSRYLYYRYRYEMNAALHRVDDFPPCIQIEPVSACNYRCVFCYQTDARFTAKAEGHMGFMAESLFKEAIDQCVGRVEAVTLASRGEPLLHPKFNALMAYTRGKFLALKLNTNASLLDEPKAHAILEAEPQTVVFSADAAAEPAYSQLRVGGRLDRVLENVRRFQEIRAKAYPSSRTITRVSGVKVPQTPGLEEMVKVWGEFVDQVAFVEYNPWQSTYDLPPHSVTEACTALWFRMFLWWDGRVNPCDNDYLSRLSVGRFPDESLSDLWRSDAFDRLRRTHHDGQRARCFPCDRCPVV